MVLVGRDVRKVLGLIRIRVLRARPKLNKIFRKAQTKRPTTKTFDELGRELQSVLGDFSYIADVLDDVRR